jgi:hypothetical protein
MDWFFNEWIYSTEMPRYRLEYTLTPDGGGAILNGTLTQSEVSPNFKMRVPIYLDLDGKLVRLGSASLIGNQSVPLQGIKLPQKPKRVLVNAFYDVLAVESASSGK